MFKKFKACLSKFCDYVIATFSDPIMRSKFRTIVNQFHWYAERGCLCDFDFDTGKAKDKNKQEEFNFYLYYRKLHDWHYKNSVTNFRYTVVIIWHVLLGALLVGGVAYGFYFLYKTGEKSAEEKLDEMHGYIKKNINVIKIDGCEYIYFHDPGYHEVSITHKGNCKNPIHKKE